MCGVIVPLFGALAMFFFFRRSVLNVVSKAMLMGDKEVAQKILTCGSPANAKKLGQTVKPWKEDLWLRERDRIMYECCLAKFKAHADLREKLLATGDAILVEASPMDKIWGIGLAADDPAAQQPKKWKGLNLLGKALMRVRDELAAQQQGGTATKKV